MTEDLKTCPFERGQVWSNPDNEIMMVRDEFTGEMQPVVRFKHVTEQLKYELLPWVGENEIISTETYEVCLKGETILNIFKSLETNPASAPLICRYIDARYVRANIVSQDQVSTALEDLNHLYGMTFCTNAEADKVFADTFAKHSEIIRALLTAHSEKISPHGTGECKHSQPHHASMNQHAAPDDDQDGGV